MSVKYKVVIKNGTTSYNGKTGKYEDSDLVLKCKDFNEAIRLFFEEAEEPFWAGDRTEVSLVFVGKGPKEKKN